MKLYDISELASEQHVKNTEINSVTDDTSRFKKGDVFVCIKGKRFDGHSVAEKMLEKGAAAVVVETDLGLSQQIIVPNTRKYFKELASAYYGNPTKKLKLVGVTGTNGKTTVVAIIKHILNALGHKTGSIGTLGIDVCGELHESDHDVPTTPRQMDLYRFFAEMVENGAEYCVMETSSQALAQYRLCDENFKCGVFTNLTQDHLDYHGIMENYYKAKKMLLKMSEKAVICLDDKYGERLFKELSCEKYGYSVTNPSDFYSVNVKLKNSGVSYWLSSEKDEKSFPIDFSIPGIFNVGNSMAAIAACVSLGFSINECVEALKSFKGVCGRSEVIWHDERLTVLCDYAHTSDALEKFLTSVKGFAKKRIICVFGAAGERDETKRFDMGRTVGELADFAVITSDNPRFEDEEKIISQVKEGMESLTTPFKTFVDRREAIAFALSVAEDGDIVALCGKGHENYQVIGDNYMHFDEREIVAELLQK